MACCFFWLAFFPFIIAFLASRLIENDEWELDWTTVIKLPYLNIVAVTRHLHSSCVLLYSSTCMKRRSAFFNFVLVANVESHKAMGSRNPVHGLTTKDHLYLPGRMLGIPLDDLD
jgi:hypothetical protein